MSSVLRQHPVNCPSILLTSDENEEIYALLGPKCITIATAIVQLYHTKPPDHSYWNKQEVGVLCFVKDNNRKNYFLRIYCLRRSGKVWEHEVYKNMDYRCNNSFLHSFEGDKCIYAFNFASDEEADKVKHVVVSKLDSLRSVVARREEVQRNAVPPQPTQNIMLQSTLKSNSKNKKHRKKLTKQDIGKPTEFRHITKVRFDCNTGLGGYTNDEVYKEIFRQAGIKDEMLANRETRDFVYNFVDSHRISKQVDATTPSPTRSAPKPPQNRTPPPPPARKLQSNKIQQTKNVEQARPPNFAPPPPPPPYRPPSLHIAPNNAPAPPPPPMPPAPPPAPLLQMDLVQSESAAVQLSESSNGDTRSALMQSIRQGANLKPVTPQNIQTGSNEPARDDMLRQIKEGISLKSAAERELKSPRASVHEVNDIAMALKKVLETRSNAIRSYDDTSSSTSSDDEWDA